MNYKRWIILIGIFVYAILLMMDFNLTMTTPQLEGALVTDYWIHLIGFPLNLLTQFLFIGILLTFSKTWSTIDRKFGVFAFFYAYIVSMSAIHVAGIVSWVC